MLLSLIFSHLLGAWLLLSFYPGELRAQYIDDVPRKLCGRQFVREVIKVCGTTGWRSAIIARHIRQEPGQMFVSLENDVDNGKLDAEVISGWKEGQIPLLKGGQDLKNVLNLYGHTEDSIPTMEEFMIGSDEFKEAIEKNKNEIKAISPLRQYDFMRGTHPRIRRDEFNLLTKCCQSSCTRRELSTVC
ncbi:prorelaxin-like [Phascolarctos cinereus]|uniref:Prorelaxin-like n=1 Tax=Phascolarctos cinereus TaxID=38626 RepID=A0A6P5LU24_PHACI|nr:prorelaxin-like [Phascolarctos cinereus]